MKRIFLLLIVIAGWAIQTQAQFPAFTDFQAKKYYKLQTKDPTVKSYFIRFGQSDSVASWLADDLATFASKKADEFYGLIEEIQKHPSLDPKMTDSLIFLWDQYQFCRDAMGFYRSINKFTGTPRPAAAIFPVKRRYEARFFYQNSPQIDSSDRKIDFLSSFVVQTNLNKTAVSSNLMSGTLWILRLDLSTTVVDNSDTTDRAKVNNKIAYGGLVNGRVSWPLYYRVTKNYALYFPLSYSVSADNVAVNKEDTIKNSFYFSELALSGYIRIPVTSSDYTVHDGPSLFFNAKMAYLDGGSNFYDKLGVVRHGFWLARATAGIELNKNLRLAVNFPLYASEKKIWTNQEATIGIQVDPKILTGKK